MSMTCMNVVAHDIEIANEDGITIYYNWKKNKTELSVSFKGNYVDEYDEYTGCVVIPESVTFDGNTYRVTSIQDFAFCYCRKLTTIIIPNSVTSIGSSAFKECYGLKNVTFPNSMTTIHDSAFENSGLISVTIPNSVTYLGAHAFRGCTKLTSVTLPKNLGEYRGIGRYVFFDCTDLTSVTIGWTTKTSNAREIFSNPENITLYVPKGSKGAFEFVNGRKVFKEVVEQTSHN